MALLLPWPPHTGWLVQRGGEYTLATRTNSLYAHGVQVDTDRLETRLHEPAVPLPRGPRGRDLWRGDGQLEHGGWVPLRAGGVGGRVAGAAGAARPAAAGVGRLHRQASGDERPAAVKMVRICTFC